MRPKVLLASGVVLASVAGAASWAGAAASKSTVHRRPDHHPAVRPSLPAHYPAARPSLAVQRQLDRALHSHFAVFRRFEHRAADSASASTAPQIANPDVVARFGLDPSAIQRVDTSSGPVWIVPGTAGACVLAGQTSTTAEPVAGANFTGCSATASILANGLIVEAGDRSRNFVFGLAPNGDSSVTVTTPAGLRQQLPVVGNVVFANVPTGPMTVTLGNASGSQVSTQYAG